MSKRAWFVDDRPLVDPCPDGLHRTGGSQFLEGADAAAFQSLSHGLGVALALADVVEEQNVNAFEPEPLQRVLVALHHPAIGEIEHRAERHGASIVMAGHGECAVRHQQAPHLGREHIVGPRLVAEEVADSPLGETRTVERGGVEAADAVVPGGLQQVADAGLGGSAFRSPSGAPPKPMRLMLRPVSPIGREAINGLPIADPGAVWS